MADIALEQLLHTAGDNTLSQTDGALHGYMRGTDGTATRTVKTDANGNITISPDSGLGKEATLAAAKNVLDTISAAVAARATEATLAAIKDALTDGSLKAQLSGSMLECYGPTVSERPAANTVPIGAVYMAVQTQQMWQSDGSQWVVM
jgi:hypothetical protein